MISSPITDMLIRIKNGYLARKEYVLVPFSKFKLEMGKLLTAKGYLSTCLEEEKGKTLKMTLKYNNKTPALAEVKIISKPSLRIYKGKKEIPRALSGLGITVVSTPKGLKTDKETRKENLGGEVICQIW